MKKGFILFWHVVFALVFVLSLDYWSWSNEVILWWLNLPSWVYYFVGVQLLFVFVLFVFTYWFWDKFFEEGETKA